MLESFVLTEHTHNYRELFSFAKFECMGHYWMYLKDCSPTTTQDMYRAMCTFWHLELQLLFKVKQFFEYELPSDKSKGELNVITQDILDEYPLDTFNMILMKYFDAAMASSEGNVESATILTKSHYKQIEDWHRIMRGFKFPT